MSAVRVRENIVLLGGVGIESSPDIIILDMTVKQWFGAKVKHGFSHFRSAITILSL